MVIQDLRPDDVSPSSMSVSSAPTSRHRLGSSTAGRLDASDAMDAIIPSANNERVSINQSINLFLENKFNINMAE